MNSTLGSDAQALNGASTEGAAVMLESMFALICGIALALYYNWKLALVAIGCVPFMVLGGFINTKLTTGMSNLEDKAL